LAKIYNSGSLFIYIKDTNEFLPLDFISKPSEYAEAIGNLI
jgi:hypothetical protein